MTDDEAIESYKKVMGDHLGLAYGKLLNDCTHLHWKWREFEILFASEQATVETLNHAAPTFFHLIQNVLWEDVLLHIARLCGPAKSSGKQNLSLKSLLDMIPADLRTRLQESIEVAEKAAGFSIEWRNRWIAHRDFDVAMGASPVQLLPRTTQADIKTVMQAIVDCLNVVSLHYIDTSVVHHPLGAIYGAQSLLCVLEDGLKANADN